jgi:hypothetical protein
VQAVSGESSTFRRPMSAGKTSAEAGGACSV